MEIDATRAPTLTTRTRALRNRRAAAWKGTASVYARVQRKTTKESRYLTIQHRGRSCDNDDIVGDVWSASRKDASSSRVAASTLRCRDPPRSRSVKGVEGNRSAI